MTLSGQCTLNLDGLSGKYPPLIIQNDDFMFPTSEEADGTRLLFFGIRQIIRDFSNSENLRRRREGFSVLSWKFAIPSQHHCGGQSDWAGHWEEQG